MSTTTCRAIETDRACELGAQPFGFTVIPGWPWPLGVVEQQATVTELVVGWQSGPRFGLLLTLDDGRTLGASIHAPALPIAQGQTVMLRLQLSEQGCNGAGFMEMREQDERLLLRFVRWDKYAPQAPQDTVAVSLADAGCDVVPDVCQLQIPAGVRYVTESGDEGLLVPGTKATVVVNGSTYVVHGGASYLEADPCGGGCVGEDFLEAMIVLAADPPILPEEPGGEGAAGPAILLPDAAAWVTQLVADHVSYEFTAVADSHGGLVIGGGTDGLVTVGGRTLGRAADPPRGEPGGPGDPKNLDCFIARLDAAGDVKWATNDGLDGHDMCRIAGVTGADEVVAARASESVLDVRWYDTSGAVTYSHRCTGLTDSPRLAVASGGTAFLGGVARTAAPSCSDSVPGEPLTSDDGWVTAVAPEGVRWARTLGGVSTDRVRAMAVSGDVLWVAGTFLSPTLEVGSSTLHALGAEALFVARFGALLGDDLGAVALSPLASNVDILALHPGPDGGVSLVFSMADGALDVAGASIVSFDMHSVVVVRFDATGEPAAIVRVGGGGVNHVRTAMADNGSLWLSANSYKGTFSLGDWTIPAPDESRWGVSAVPFLMRFDGQLVPDRAYLAARPFEPHAIVAAQGGLHIVAPGGKWAASGFPSGPGAPELVLGGVVLP